MKIEKYKGYDLHIGGIVHNPNGRKTQSVLVYKGDEMVRGAYADIELECAISKAKAKVDCLILEK